jgi:putative membrane protein
VHRWNGDDGGGIMPGPFMRFMQRWLVNTLAVLMAANVIRGIEYETVPSLLVASLLLGILNALLRPLLLLLSLPLVIFTLGLFTLVINALLLMLVGQLVIAFHVADFWAAFWGALVISVVSLILNTLTGSGEHRIEWRRDPPDRPPRPPRGGGGDGPVIDV